MYFLRFLDRYCIHKFYNRKANAIVIHINLRYIVVGVVKMINQVQNIAERKAMKKINYNH